MSREAILQQISTSLPDAVRHYQDPAHEVGLSVLRELAQNDLGTPGVALFLASMPNTPTRVLEQLCQLDDLEVGLQLANNPAMHPRLIGHPSPVVRRKLAAHRRLAPAVAQQLTKDPDAFVRVELAKNPAIDIPIQRKLLEEDPVSFVRLALMENRKLEPEFMAGLSDDLESTIHACAILMSPRLPLKSINDWLEVNEELGHLALAMRNDLLPNAIARLAQSQFPSVRLSLLRHQSNIPEKVLDEYLNSTDAESLRCIAMRPQLSVAVQHKLVANPAFPDDARLALARRGDLADSVGVELCEENAPESRLLALAENLAEGLVQTRRRLAAKRNSYLLKLLLANPFATQDPATLSTLVLNADDNVLCHLVFRAIPCMGLSPEARERLANSALPSVRKLVAQSL